MGELYVKCNLTIDTVHSLASDLSEIHAQQTKKQIVSFVIISIVAFGLWKLAYTPKMFS